MIGIGITTRNRPDVLEHTLMMFKRHLHDSHQIVVVDDQSTEWLRNKKTAESFGFSYLHNPTRLGIAKSKNRCLEFLDNGVNKYFILFDDDCFPLVDRWHEPYVEGCEQGGQHHFIYAYPYNGRHGITLKEKRDHYWVWYGCHGCVIFLSKKALDTVGGWDNEFSFYGFEHYDLTFRCKLAGLMTDLYETPKDIDKIFWAFDLRGDHEGFKWPCRSCVTEEDKMHSIPLNQQIMHKNVQECQKGASVFRSYRIGLSDKNETR